MGQFPSATKLRQPQPSQIEATGLNATINPNKMADIQKTLKSNMSPSIFHLRHGTMLNTISSSTVPSKMTPEAAIVLGPESFG
ncbi:hypothetical protein JTE90_012930 [Oedothorax gibbosus]|uniref:Uncharacterized protein n=1 Tax=Oedothorax gibbosus TaxID=931172 RepID=A0AAV6V1U1_9ARAC|nr:hypothetical protein JTE90_012930 [Oedothorax gibbosus]